MGLPLVTEWRIENLFNEMAEKVSPEFAHHFITQTIPDIFVFLLRVALNIPQIGEEYIGEFVNMTRNIMVKIELALQPVGIYTHQTL